MALKALYVFPANHLIQCPPSKNKLGFSFDSSRCLSLANSRGNPMSRASSNMFSSSFGPIVTVPVANSFVVRSDSGSNGPAEASESVEDEIVVDIEESSENLESEGSSNVESEPERPARQPRIKLGEIMGILNKRAVEASEEQRPVPGIRTGDIVEIKLEVPENRRRLSVYKGIVMSRQNAGIHTTIRIRRIIAGVGVEIVFPLYSPNIKEIKVVNHRKVRKARLYYLRDKLPRLSTFK